jgi:hypothetical protein
MHLLPTIIAVFCTSLTMAQDITPYGEDRHTAASIIFCNSKPYGAYVNPSDPSCLYFCYGTVFTGTGSNGYTSCCKTGFCFNLPSLAYPLGACLACAPPPRYPLINIKYEPDKGWKSSALCCCGFLDRGVFWGGENRKRRREGRWTGGRWARNKVGRKEGCGWIDIPPAPQRQEEQSRNGES